MSIRLPDLVAIGQPVVVIVHSLDRSLYHITVAVDGREQLLLDATGKTLRCRSINAVRERLAGIEVERMVLRQNSAYDEMIGHPPRQADNTLEVGLAKEAFDAK